MCDRREKSVPYLVTSWRYSSLLFSTSTAITKRGCKKSRITSAGKLSTYPIINETSQRTDRQIMNDKWSWRSEEVDGMDSVVNGYRVYLHRLINHHFVIAWEVNNPIWSLMHAPHAIMYLFTTHTHTYNNLSTTKVAKRTGVSGDHTNAMHTNIRFT
jgi:hypothetical protein